MVYCHDSINSNMFICNNYKYNIVNYINYYIDSIVVIICSDIYDNTMRVIRTIIIHF